ncbi:MAG: hypothetical protein CVT80_15910 [Alphaproteobacteria bacterium HGW-Alphaproteobacteria-2]|nr:MAG: hypothetical protein CVT80_15910 [Alphaproteobacteria bacterium HGW-Alphaproteobacteria-2]
MPFRLVPRDPTLEAAFRRMAREQADEAVAKIEAARLAPDVTVHEVRKHAKKLRGLIRLFRPVFGDHAKENAAIRDAARRLSGSRDRAVMLKTHDALVAWLPPGAERRALAPLRARLTQLARGARGGDMVAELAACAEVMRGVAERAGHWRLEAEGRAALEPGLARVWKQARARLAEARKARTPEAIHEWRKRVKDHWYHARILTPVFPEIVGAQSAVANVLGETLGVANDIAVYRRWLDGPESDGIAAERRAVADALAAVRQEELLAQGFALGERLFAEPAGAMAARWAAWWDIWKQECG